MTRCDLLMYMLKVEVPTLLEDCIHSASFR